LQQVEQAPTHEAPFLAHYAAVAPERFDAVSLSWHLAVQSLLQASRAFVYQAPDWLERMDERLQICAAQVARIRGEGRP
jgi:hypothetical protein